MLRALERVTKAKYTLRFLQNISLRRQFMSNNSASTTTTSTPPQLQVFRSLWGVCDTPDDPWTPFAKMDDAIFEIARLGYNGVEIPLKFVLFYGLDNFRKLLQQHQLRCIIMVFTDGPVAPHPLDDFKVFGGPYLDFPQEGKSVQEHFDVFKAQVEIARSLNPVLINSHSGKDYFTSEQADEYFTKCLDFAPNVAHESHRGRILYSPWVSRNILRKFPSLQCVSDISHWVNVAESSANEPVLKEFIASEFSTHVRHTHLRVGHSQGPQVSDPSVPEFKDELHGHEALWHHAWKLAAERGDKIITCTTEHGPAPYQPIDPQTKRPLCEIWEKNHWLALRQQDAYANMFGSAYTSKLIPVGDTNDTGPRLSSRLSTDYKN